MACVARWVPTSPHTPVRGMGWDGAWRAGCQRHPTRLAWHWLGTYTSPQASPTAAADAGRRRTAPTQQAAHCRQRAWAWQYCPPGRRGGHQPHKHNSVSMVIITQRSERLSTRAEVRQLLDPRREASSNSTAPQVAMTRVDGPHVQQSLRSVSLKVPGEIRKRSSQLLWWNGGEKLWHASLLLTSDMP
jgi:hypothetical protein